MRIRIVIAVSAVAVLAVGYGVRPRTEVSAPAMEEQPSPILREVVERREAATVFAALQQTARTVLPVTARLTPPPPPFDRWSDWRPAPAIDRSRFAVAIGDWRLLGDAADLAEGTTVDVQMGDGRAFTALVMARFPEARLALLVLDGGEPLPQPGAGQATVTAGDVVVGVAPGEDGLVAVPMVIAEVRRGGLDVTGEIDRYLGLPVFTAAGVWLGVVAAGPDGMRIVRVEDVLSAPSAEQPPARPLGLSLRYAREAPADGRPRAVVIEDVAPDGVAASAGLRPADVILTIGGEEPVDLEAAVAALTADRTTPLVLRLRRGTRTVVVRLAMVDQSPR